MLAACCLCVFLVSPAQQAITEADALAAVKLATNPSLKLAAAEDFIARFPNSTARLAVAELVGNEILKVKNGSVALALFERARAIFTSDQERELLKPVALECYAMGNRPDDAFALSGELLAKSPDDLHVLVLMTQVGTDETRKKNRKYSDVSLQYGLKAIALIESGNDNAYKPTLGQLYQQTAILYLAAQNTAEAKSRLTRAAELSPQDPGNFALLGRVINADYVAQMKTYDAMPDGKWKEDERKRLESVLDSVIDAYARAAGLATGRAEYQALLQQVIPDLATYYKHRYKSTNGLRQLIDRYRPKL